MISRAKLKELYIDKGLYQKEIAEKYDVCQQTVSKWIKKYDINTGWQNDYKDVKKYFKEHGCKLLSNGYKNNRTKLKYKCECGNISYITFSNFKKGQRCYKCRNKKISKSKTYNYKFVKEYFDKHNCKLLSKHYKNNEQELKYKCECDNVSYITFDSFKNQNARCEKCMPERISKAQRKTQKQFEKEVNKIHNDKIKVMGKYKNDRTKIKVKCTKCNYIWKPQAGSLIQGNGCPQCNESKGEKKIKEWLNKNNIDYEREYKFDDCRNVYALPFDFKLNINNETILLEYDGIQHFKPLAYFGGEKQFKYIKHNDSIKNEYCKQNNILLIRISYKEKDKIAEILGEIVRKAGD